MVHVEADVVREKVERIYCETTCLVNFGKIQDRIVNFRAKRITVSKESKISSCFGTVWIHQPRPLTCNAQAPRVLYII